MGERLGDDAGRGRRGQVHDRAVGRVGRAGDRLLRRKLPAEAAATAARLADLEPAKAPNFYNAACLNSLAAAALTVDRGVPDDPRSKTAEAFAASAMAHLRRAAKMGFFDVPANVEQFGKDTDLDALRDRDDFRRFVDSLH
ncbi:MAG TPA: hypothetical protein VGX76_02610 [Pirellulales bacterium]|nr:hypothetical protein [Pirellulales bacterium]